MWLSALAVLIAAATSDFALIVPECLTSRLPPDQLRAMLSADRASSRLVSARVVTTHCEEVDPAIEIELRLHDDSAIHRRAVPLADVAPDARVRTVALAILVLAESPASDPPAPQAEPTPLDPPLRPAPTAPNASPAADLPVVEGPVRPRSALSPVAPPPLVPTRVDRFATHVSLAFAAETPIRDATPTLGARLALSHRWGLHRAVAEIGIGSTEGDSGPPAEGAVGIRIVEVGIGYLLVLDLDRFELGAGAVVSGGFASAVATSRTPSFVAVSRVAALFSVGLCTRASVDLTPSWFLAAELRGRGHVAGMEATAADVPIAGQRGVSFGGSLGLGVRL